MERRVKEEGEEWWKGEEEREWRGGKGRRDEGKGRRDEGRRRESGGEVESMVHAGASLTTHMSTQ